MSICPGLSVAASTVGTFLDLSALILDQSAPLVPQAGYALPEDPDLGLLLLNLVPNVLGRCRAALFWTRPAGPAHGLGLNTGGMLSSRRGRLGDRRAGLVAAGALGAVDRASDLAGGVNGNRFALPAVLAVVGVAVVGVALAAVVGIGLGGCAGSRLLFCRSSLRAKDDGSSDR